MKVRLVPGLQQGGHTAHSVRTDGEKMAGSWLSISQRPACAFAESANISRLSGVKADESHLA